jgi:hypothetical protein
MTVELEHAFAGLAIAVPDKKPKRRQSPEKLIPISKINLSHSGGAVCGRVTSKTALTRAARWWAGPWFSFDLKDKTGEISVISFGPVAERLVDEIQVGRVYCISDFNVRDAVKQFSALSHEYKLKALKRTVIREADELEKTCPQLKVRYTDLSEIKYTKVGSIVNVVAVIHRNKRMKKVSQQLGFKKKDIILVDRSGEVTLTLWRVKAEDFVGRKGNSVIIRKAVVSEYKGQKYLTSTASYSMEQNPDDDAADRLLTWYKLTKGNDSPVMACL